MMAAGQELHRHRNQGSRVSALAGLISYGPNQGGGRDYRAFEEGGKGKWVKIAGEKLKKENNKISNRECESGGGDHTPLKGRDR